MNTTTTRRPLARRPLKTLSLTELGLGGATLAGNMAPVAEAEARAIIRRAVDAGIGYFDTAPFYGYGRSERIMGDGLRDVANRVISTKVGRLLKPRSGPQDPNDPWKEPLPFEPVYDYSYDGVMRSFEDSLQRLGLDKVDILYLHDIGAMTHGAEAHPRLMKIAMEGGLKALDELRRSGVVSAIGLGVNEWQVCREALEHGDIDVFLLAGRYTLLEQEPIETLFPECRRRGTRIVIGGPFNSGVLVGRETWNYARAPAEVIERVRRIEGVCRDHGVPLAAAALQFPLVNDLIVSVIPGPRSVAELEQILDWFGVTIPAGLWRDLKAAGLMHPEAPVPA